MDIHKDCYSAIDLIRQDGPHRRETHQAGARHSQSPIEADGGAVMKHPSISEIQHPVRIAHVATSLNGARPNTAPASGPQ
jgi:hypothetical protein